MPQRHWFRLAEIVAAILLALAVYFSWRAAAAIVRSSSPN
jgi:hypothetical protein